MEEAQAAAPAAACTRSQNLLEYGWLYQIPSLRNSGMLYLPYDAHDALCYCYGPKNWNRRQWLHFQKWSGADSERKNLPRFAKFENLAALCFEFRNQMLFTTWNLPVEQSIMFENRKM